MRKDLKQKFIKTEKNLNSKEKSISKNVLLNTVLTLSNFAFPLITYSHVARILGPAGIGKVAFVNSILQYFSYLAILGIPVYGLRECSKLRNDKEALSHLVQELLVIAIIATVFSYIGLIGLIFFSETLAEYRPLFIVMGVHIFLNSIGVEWIYQAYEEYFYITIRSLVFKCISVILTFILIQNQNSILEYGFITIFASSANCIFNFINIRHFISFKKKKKYNLRRHIKAVLILFSASMVITVYSNFDVVMLGIISGENEVGIYNTALKIKNILLSLSTAATSVLIPRISYYIKNKRLDKIEHLIANTVRISMLLSVPASIYIFIFAHDVILFLCGREYLSAISTLRVLIACIFPLILTNLFGCQLLIPLGKEKRYTQSVFVGMWINLALNSLLIPHFGAFGAAIGTFITEIWNVFWMGNGISEYLSVIFKGICYAKYVIPIVVSGIIVMPLCFFVQYANCLVRLAVTSIIFFGAFYFCQILNGEPLVRCFINRIRKKLMCEFRDNE